MVGRYPDMGDSLGWTQNLDWSFDPQMHVWEIREVEKAMDSVFIRQILDDVYNLENGDAYREDMEKKIEILKKFVGSEAFGT